MRTLLVAMFVLAPLSALAEPHAHGEHDHGPTDLGNIGKARLETSCADAARAEIDRGVTLMHSFWYGEAETAFRNAAAADAACGMAWWGVAMSNLHPIWAPPTPAELATGAEAVEKAKSAGTKTARETAYVDAIGAFYAKAGELDHGKRMAAYERAMADLARSHPDDREAGIFHALALLGTADAKDKTYAKQKQAAEILNRLLPLEPEHPGVAHYLIHSFDYPELAALALPAARVYAKLAPGSPHALHMPSHIFVRLGLWEESIASNLASKDKADAYVARVKPGAAAFDALHAVDYLVYAYLQQGKDDEARKLVEVTAAVATLDVPNQFAAAYAIGAVPARYTLERGRWDEAAALAVPKNVAWEKVPYAEANIHFARGVGGARAGKLDVARDAERRLAAIRQALLDQKNAYWADQVEIQRLCVAARIAAAEKKSDQALDTMRAAAAMEAGTEKHPVTPGAIVPAREMLAELLLENGRGEEAAAEAEQVLRSAPNRRAAMQLAARAKIENGAKGGTGAAAD
ncbi:MAG: hypothetical protein ACREQJ_07540 [Candidatus Binatia bacterium]